MRLLYEKLLEKKMNSFRITNPNIICGRIANPPERRTNYLIITNHYDKTCITFCLSIVSHDCFV